LKLTARPVVEKEAKKTMSLQKRQPDKVGRELKGLKRKGQAAAAKEKIL